MFAVRVAPAGFTTLQVIVRSPRSPPSTPFSALAVATSASVVAATTGDGAAGPSTILATRRITRTVAVPVRTPVAAVMRADPGATAVTAPVVALIESTPGL